jgi:hypothetical protein
MDGVVLMLSRTMSPNILYLIFFQYQLLTTRFIKKQNYSLF